MSADLNAQSAALALQSTAAATGARTTSYAAAQKAAKDFEGVFITQMLSQMFQGVSTDTEFGGGAGEEMFRSLMIDEYGKQISTHGGIGLAKGVLKELVKAQERAS
jgi:peptidoglycan hydrolase FlgJ